MALNVSLHNIGIIALLVGACAVGFVYVTLREWRTPAPIRMWNAHRAELEQFAEESFTAHTFGTVRINGGIPSSGVFAVPEFLREGSDVGYVQLHDGVMEIDFTFMPCDAVPVLAYCSKRLPGARLPQKEPTWTYFKAQELSTKWIYYEWDN